MNKQTSAYQLVKQSHPINGQALIQSAICRALPSNGTVAIENLSQSVLATLIKHAGLGSITMVGVPILKKYGAKLWREFSNQRRLVECIGAESGELYIQSKMEAGFSSLAEKPLVIHQKSLDDAFVGRKNLCWLAFDDGAVELLESGEECIRLQRPLISFASFASLESAAKWCSSHDYILLNADLSPPASTDEQGLYLFPDQALLSAVKALLTPAHDLSQNSIRLKENIKHVWPQLCASTDALARQTCSYLQMNERLYDLDDMIGFNLYKSEDHNGTEWRWTGPGHDAIVLLPMRAKGLYCVELTVLAMPEGLESTVVRCFMNGKPHFEGKLSAGNLISFSYYAENPHAPIELLISSENTVTLGGRELGVAISAIKVKWENGNA